MKMSSSLQSAVITNPLADDVKPNSTSTFSCPASRRASVPATAGFDVSSA